jgi:hypothetical protein
MRSPLTKILAIIPHLLPLGLAMVAWSTHYGRLFVGHDTMFHLLRVVTLHHNISRGILYPRWVTELYLGLGYPLLNFYAPGTYYVAEIFHLLGADYPNALTYTMLALTLLAGVGVYRLALDFFADLLPDTSYIGNNTPTLVQCAALVTTAAYLFAPYLFFNLYVRGAVAELGAQALLPWVLWSFRRLLKDPYPVKYLLWSVLSLAAVAWTHTISLMLIPPVLVAYAVVLLWPDGQQRMEWRERAGWFVTATLIAAGLSAFVWLPILVERQFLSDFVQQAVLRNLSGHVSSWEDFLDFSFLYHYDNLAPPALGLVQVGLALLGTLFVVRRSREWYFLLVLTLVTLLAISEISLPIWERFALLRTIQFPWRILSITTLPLVLLTGGVITRLGRPYSYLVGSVVLITMIVFVNFPRVEWMRQYQLEPAQVNLTSIAQYESIHEDYGLSSSHYQEFTPRWAKAVKPTHVAAVPGSSFTVAVHEASSHRIAMTVSAPETAPLYFSNFYFPGWQATLDTGQELAPYPAADSGLLTLDIPAGQHELQIRWNDTWPQDWGRLLSLASAIVLILFCLMQPNQHWLALCPLALSFIILATAVSTPLSSPTFQATPQHEVAKGITLLGYYAYQDPDHAEHLYLFPYWHVSEPLADLQMQWQLLDSTGTAVAETRDSPYFNTLQTSDWLPNMLVDDLYYLPLPPGLPAGSYTLALQVSPTRSNPTKNQLEQPVQPIGKIAIPRATQAEPEWPNPLEAHFTAPDHDYQVTLRGYDLQVEPDAADTNSEERSPMESPFPVAEPGDAVVYTLYWQANHAVPRGYRVFNQLVGHDWQVLAQVNEPLELFSEPLYSLWNPSYVRANHYRLQIPTDAASGLYRPQVWLYEPESGEEFAAHTTDGSSDAEAIFLEPLKIARRSAPVQRAIARFGDAIALTDYRIEVPSTGLHPQSTFTVTLNYQALAPTPQDQVQFIHFFSQDLGMAAQFDTPPQGGGNPTSTWLPGELITETIPLSIDPLARPGHYTLRVGFYDPLAGGVRMSALNENQQVQPDNYIVLGEVEVK